MAVNFAGNSSFRQTSATGMPGSVITAAFWLKFNSLPTSGNYMNVINIAGGTGEFYLELPGVDMILQANGLEGGGALVTGQWYRVAAVRNGASSALYVTSVATGALTAVATGSMADYPTAPNVLNVGSSGGTGATVERLDGRMINLKIWSVALTATQIATELGSYTVANPTGLLRAHRWDSTASAIPDSGSAGTFTTPSGVPAFISDTPTPLAGTIISKTGGAAGVGAGSGAKTVSTGGGAGASVRSTATGVEASSASHSVTIPTGTAAGDVLVVAFAYDNITGGLNEANTTSTGWVKLDRQSQGTGTNIAATLFWKRATGSDALTVTLTEAQEAAYVAVAVQGNGGDPLFAGTNGSAAPATLAPATVTAGDYVSLLFVGIDANPPVDQTITPPSGYSNLAEAEPVGAGSQVGMYALDSDALVTASTSIAPGSVGFSTSDQWVSFNVAIASPPAGTTIDKTGGAAAVGAGSGAKTTGTAIPAQVYDLTRWHWTLPTEDPGPDTDAEQIDQPALATYFDEHFYVDADGYLVSVAPVNGSTTSGSGGTRSEGREHESNYDNSAWDPNTTGPRQFTITTRADPTSITGGTNPRQEMIIYQIHGASGTPPIYFAAEWTSNGVPVDPPRIRMFVSGTGMANANVVTGITTDTPITIRVRVANAQLTAWVVDGEVGDLPTTPTFGPVDTADFNDQLAWYFKGGGYNKTEAGTGSSGQAIARISHWELLQPGDATTYDKTGGAAALGAGSGSAEIVPAAVYVKAGGAAAVGAGVGARERTHDRAGGAAALGAGDGARQLMRSFSGGAAAIGAGSGTAVVSTPAVHIRSGGAAALGAGSGSADVQHPAVLDRTGGAAALGAGSGAADVIHVNIYDKTGGAAALGAGSGARELVHSKAGGAAAYGAGSGAVDVAAATGHNRSGGAAAVGAGSGVREVQQPATHDKTGGAAALGAGSGTADVQPPVIHTKSGGAAGVAAGSGVRDYVRSFTGGAAGVAAGSGAAVVVPPAVHARTGGGAPVGAGVGAIDVASAGGHTRTGGAAGVGAGAGAAVVQPPTVYVKSGGAAGLGAGIALVEVIPAAVYVRTGGAAAIGAGSGRGRVGGAFHAGRPYRAGSWHAGEPTAAGRHHAGAPYPVGQHHAGAITAS